MPRIPVIHAKHLPTQIACHLAQTTNIGLNKWNITAIRYCNPALPPGKNDIKYQANAINCATDVDITNKYPDAPPNENVQYNVKKIDPK